jgi:hypothetical protein
MPLFDAMFPFAKRGEYFLLYGRRGLAEYQAIVPHAAASEFLGALERAALGSRPPIVMASLKLFRGEPKLLRFEGDGVCVTLDLVRSAEGLRFLEVLDRLTLEHGALPHIVKDSRLPAAVVARSYPGYEEFRERRRRSTRRRASIRALGEARAVTAVIVGASAGLGRALPRRSPRPATILVLVSAMPVTSRRPRPTCGSGTG